MCIGPLYILLLRFFPYIHSQKVVASVAAAAASAVTSFRRCSFECNFIFLSFVRLRSFFSHSYSYLCNTFLSFMCEDGCDVCVVLSWVCVCLFFLLLYRMRLQFAIICSWKIHVVRTPHSIHAQSTHNKHPSSMHRASCITEKNTLSRMKIAIRIRCMHTHCICVLFFFCCCCCCSSSRSSFLNIIISLFVAVVVQFLARFEYAKR